VAHKVGARSHDEPAGLGQRCGTPRRRRAKDGAKDMRTRPVADDLDGAGEYPWFGVPDDRGRVRLAANIAAAASVPVLALAWVIDNHVPTRPALDIVAIAVVSGVALCYRARWPLAVLLVALVGVMAALLVDRESPALGFGCEIALFTVASLRTRRVSGTAAFVSAAVLFAAERTDSTGSMTAPGALIVVVWTALAYALGTVVSTERAYVNALAERARRTDEKREQEARTRVVEERVRIARELHDVMAHHIAVINVHAGLARRAIGRDAGTVDTSLRHVQEAARTVLDELGTVLSVLRTTDDRESASEPTTEPVPGLERLDELLETFAAAGFEVRTRATGRMRDMDRACDLAAFRIIQESLTNASKHGADGQAELTLVYAASGLTIGVSNLVRLDPPGFSTIIPAPVGHGLIGMRERAVACGGSLTVRQDDRGLFCVVAVIPHRPTRVPGITATTAQDALFRHLSRAQPVGPV
jgi:signal transduction histidine kinase